MTPRLILSLGMSALVLGGTMVGCTGTAGRIASASDRSAALAARTAARDADKAARALARRDAATAVPLAESAVALAPRDAGYRMLLGQGYLQAGRFASARDSFADVLQLTPDNGKAALNLALAQIATGDWSAARTTLDTHAAIIPVGDLGLATALAGNPDGAVQILNAAARAPGADAKVRQNLALSYALAGNWSMARVAAAADMSAADVDARIEQWATFAKPAHASQQVASLLGVTPVADTGRPIALALNAAVPVTPVQDTPVQTAAVETPVVIAAPVVAATPAAVPSPAAASPFAKVSFAARREVVQPLPTMLIRADAAPAKLALRGNGSKRVVQAVPAATPFVRPQPAGGDWYVQLGAFSNAAVAKSGWTSATRRFAALSGHQPTGTNFAARQGSLYRLSVGGFSRQSADQMCRSYRAKGGTCFVRREAGDRMAQWLRSPVQLASR
ncbi:tetratricopeptide repeat protein [Sphingomonas sp. RP10(2022)]|uniref:Tetratricopeptide repeat protein n=1 Tax=Sphingomonas liriopis TaxID=2949094 RepID=A0A9X2HVY8_9SPHN|nr:tetratricopeptide repeat protein [Sphingomonas liriopis]MCP3734524.1 tetratricopeptide repeat protein [Sphingomonas liriopis]